MVGCCKAEWMKVMLLHGQISVFGKKGKKTKYVEECVNLKIIHIIQLVRSIITYFVFTLLQHLPKLYDSYSV